MQHLQDTEGIKKSTICQSFLNPSNFLEPNNHTQSLTEHRKIVNILDSSAVTDSVRIECFSEFKGFQ